MYLGTTSTRAGQSLNTVYNGVTGYGDIAGYLCATDMSYYVKYNPTITKYNPPSNMYNFTTTRLGLVVRFGKS
jgi:hypothetical protein